MVTHYFTLHVLSKELNETLRGAVIHEVFTQQKNELLITLRRGDTEYCLCISVEPKLNYIFIRDVFARAKKNSVDLFQLIVDTTVQEIALQAYERTLIMTMGNGMMLVVQLYNTTASNVVLLNGDNQIVEAFKRNKEHQGKNFIEKAARWDSKLLHDSQRWEQTVLQQGEAAIFLRMKQIIPILGSTFIREVLHRSNMSENTIAGNLTTNEFERIRQSVSSIFNELEHPYAGIYYQGEIPSILSVIPLQHLAGSKSESFQSVNDAVRKFISLSHKVQHVDDEKHTLVKKIKTILEHTQKSIDSIDKQLSESKRTAEYERIGKIITANLPHLTKGTKEIELTDFFEHDKTISITLDPKLTPAQNAERYFAKAKKSKLARTESEQRHVQLVQSVSLLEKMLLHLDNCQTSEQVKEFQQVYRQELKKLGLAKGEEKKAPMPFRIFTVAGELEVWVGKSSASNDELTMKYAKPHDLWFHARGASGSHTVLKLPNKNSMPSKEAILQAACIAAYYSKMRNAKNVPVAYCERKYVRKPKRAPEGTVVLEREEVVFVKPALP